MDDGSPERPSGRVRRRGAAALLALVPLVVAALIGAAAAGAAAQSARGEGRAAGLARELGPGVRVLAHEETSQVRFIGTAAGRPIERPPGVAASAPAANAARAFLERYGSYFGLRDAGQELRVDAVREASGGRASVRLQQLHEGVPVLGGELVVNLDRDREVLSVSGEASPRPSLRVEPGVSSSAARAAALAAIAKAHGVAPDGLRPSAPELWIYDSRLLGAPGPGRPRLAWRLEVTAPSRPIRELVLVDAQVGSVALHFNQIAHGLDREVCDAGNTASEYPCTPAAAERSEGDLPTGQADVDDAYDFSGDTYDFFFDRFGRDGLDGAGKSLFSTVRYCPPGEPCPYENAFWDGEQMVYGQGLAVDDVVGHELTHGVTEFSSHLFYYYQSGAINESLSDVFGELIDLTNGAGTDTAAVRWLLGEDIPGIGAIRDMQDPAAFGDPDRMTSSNYTADLSETDAGGVHANSGVNNKAAYLMTDGDTFNGVSVTGLGIDKAARIYYEVEANFLVSASDYADLGAGLQQACTNLIGTGGIGTADCTEVADVVAAVEMDQDPPPAAAPPPEPPTCTSGSPVEVFFDDLENPASGNWVRTENVGSNEWYYPQNSNPYAFDATYATSGATNFWGYDRPSLGDFSIEMSSDVTVPAGGLIRFEHAYGFEDSVGPPRDWDGGVVEYSVNGGASWADAGPLFLENGYTGTIYAGGAANNPLKGRQAFVRESNGYTSSRLDLSSLADQQIRFRFRIGTDSSVDDYGWFIDDVRIYSCAGADTDPPETTITSGPSGPTNDATPTFTFSSDEPGSTFECRFDGDPFGACSGPDDSHTPAAPLADGAHSFGVRATDPSANTDPTPASRGFTVDTAAPAPPTITDTDPDGPANDNNPEVKGSAEAGSTVKLYESADCTGAVEAQESAATFNSPGLTASVADNTNTQFTATVADAAGNTSPCSAPFGYIEDSNPPDTQINSGPAGPTNDSTPTFTFTSPDGGVSFECKEDSGAFGGCSDPGNQHTFPALGDGPHSFGVRASDAAGNVDPTPASRAFTVDTADPSSLITFPQNATAYTSVNYAAGCADGTPDVCGTASDTVGLDKVEVRIQRASDGDYWNGASWQPGEVWLLANGAASWSFGFSPAEDTHTLSSRATDTAGNVESTATATFTIDDSAPSAPTITDTDPDGPANDNNPEVKGIVGAGDPAHVWIYTNAGCTGAPNATNTVAQFTGAGITVSVPGDTTSPLSARAVDAASNESACSAAFGYIEDSTPPTDPTLSSPSHTTGVPSDDPTVDVTFSGATDELSGVDGFSYLWDTSPATTPDTTKDAEETADSTTSPSLADGASHYFHLRTRDNAGNWTSTVHLGPFVIDTQDSSGPPPSPPPLSPPPALSPDSAPPNGSLAASPKQKAGGAVTLAVSCDEPCTALAAGLVVANAGKKSLAAVSARKRKFKLKAARVELTAGQSAILRLKPKGKKSKRTIRRLVRRGARAKAKITVTLRDRVGNSTTRKLVVKLKK